MNMDTQIFLCPIWNAHSKIIEQYVINSAPVSTADSIAQYVYVDILLQQSFFSLAIIETSGGVAHSYDLSNHKKRDMPNGLKFPKKPKTLKSDQAQNFRKCCSYIDKCSVTV